MAVRGLGKKMLYYIHIDKVCRESRGSIKKSCRAFITEMSILFRARPGTSEKNGNYLGQTIIVYIIHKYIKNIRILLL